MLRHRAMETGSTTAFIGARDGTTRTWEQIAIAVEQWDHWLCASGAPVGALVGLSLSDPLDFASAFLAIAASRRWVAPVDAAAPPASQQQAWARLVPAVVVGDRGIRPTTPSGGDGAATTWAPAIPPLVRPHGGVVLSSSGTTGTPKVVALDQRRLLHTARMVVLHHRIGPSDRAHNALPLFHVNAEVVVLLSTVLSGASAVLDNGFHRRNFWSTITGHQVTWVNAVPAIIARLCQADPAGNEDAALQDARQAVRFVRSASAPLPAAVRARFEERAGIPVVESYGMTEAGSQICATPLDGRAAPGSVGRPIGVELRIQQGGDPCPPGTTGGIEIRGPGVVAEYATPADNDRIDEDRWLTTGDLGYTDAQGNVHLVGRCDDVINRGGEKLAPREVEELLAHDPDVEDAAVIGQPDLVLGQVPAAYVTIRPSVPSVLPVLSRLRDRCANRLPAPKCPVSFTALIAMPRGPTGKIQRHRLATVASGCIIEQLPGP